MAVIETHAHLAWLCKQLAVDVKGLNVDDKELAHDGKQLNVDDKELAHDD